MRGSYRANSKSPRTCPTRSRAYEAERKPRTTRAQRGARRPDGPLPQARLAAQLTTYGPMWLAAHLAPQVVHTRHDWLYSHDVCRGREKIANQKSGRERPFPATPAARLDLQQPRNVIMCCRCASAAARTLLTLPNNAASWHRRFSRCQPFVLRSPGPVDDDLNAFVLGQFHRCAVAEPNADHRGFGHGCARADLSDSPLSRTARPQQPSHSGQRGCTRIAPSQIQPGAKPR